MPELVEKTPKEKYKTKIKPHHSDFIRSNFDLSNEELAEETGLPTRIIELYRKIDNNPELQGQGYKSGTKIEIKQAIREKEGVFTMSKAADYLDMAYSSLQRYISNGRLKARKINDVYMIREKDLLKLKEKGLKGNEIVERKEGYLTTKQASERTDYARSTIAEKCRDGVIDCEKIKNYYAVPEDELETLREHKKEQKRRKYES